MSADFGHSVLLLLPVACEQFLIYIFYKYNLYCTYKIAIHPRVAIVLRCKRKWHFQTTNDITLNAVHQLIHKVSNFLMLDVLETYGLFGDGKGSAPIYNLLMSSSRRMVKTTYSKFITYAATIFELITILDLCRKVTSGHSTFWHLAMAITANMTAFLKQGIEDQMNRWFKITLQMTRPRTKACGTGPYVQLSKEFSWLSPANHRWPLGIYDRTDVTNIFVNVLKAVCKMCATTQLLLASNPGPLKRSLLKQPDCIFHITLKSCG